MNKIMVIFLITNFVFFSFPVVSNACSCVESQGVEESLEQSDALFSGKVVDIKEKQGVNKFPSKSVLLEVSNTWKGVNQSQIIITTGLSDSDCGFNFKVGQEYLVYAHESDMYGEKTLITTSCNRTNDLNSSQEDLKILSKGQEPKEEVDLTDEFEGYQYYLWILFGGIFVIILFFIWKRRK
ncbi:hypothetical protein LC087_18060 [Bacillus carboniphilus]|uniref:Tissue inhibitor of metalloproteinase n=1 Tax=Bacillus carboniphilus TaxID=86663 RepID=A0ABY9JT56_9BACI|nr:hypothetical protein [Bacillus carboniphilus]WLR42564.1 hypothetical protein LC087_18060 [Bacillus carboniphilus]